MQMPELTPRYQIAPPLSLFALLSVKLQLITVIADFFPEIAPPLI